MKPFLNLFLVLLLVILNGDRVVDCKNMLSEKAVFLFDTIKSAGKQAVVNNKETIGTDAPDGVPRKKKKRNRKGIKSVPLCIVNVSYNRINRINDEVILPAQVSYYFQTFSTNGKRGPPSGC